MALFAILAVSTGGRSGDFLPLTSAPGLPRLAAMKLRITTLLLASALACAPACNASSTAGSDTGVADVSEDVTDALPGDVSGDTLSEPDSGSDGDAPEDTGALDTAVADVADTAVADTAVADTAVADTAVADVNPGEKATVWGTILGTSCGGLEAEIASPAPSFLTSTWEIDVATFDPDLLDTGPAYRFSQPNAGGSSKCSEVMSLQWIIACEDADLYKIETAISYDTVGSITDYEVLIGGDKVGVSVTRAYLGPTVTEYDTAKATTLLEKKLAGINESSANVSAEDAWVKQILYVWTLRADWVPLLEEAWDALSADLKADTIVLVAVESGTEYIVKDTCDDAQ